MAQHTFAHFTHANGANIDPNHLSMAAGLSSPYTAVNNYHAASNQSNAFSTGSAVFDDDELLDGLTSPADNQHMHNHDLNHDFGNMNMGGFTQPNFTHRASLHIDPVNGYSTTPDGDPIHSPYSHSHGFASQFRQQMSTSLHSPMSYSASPMAAADMAARATISHEMQTKPSNNRTPMTPKTNSIHGIPIASQDSPSFGPQSMRHSGSHDKSPAHWLNTPNGSISASYNSGFSSPMQQSMVPINEVMMKGGTSMPAKLNGAPNAVSSQEMKRKRRRESHNLVERRRRDNINERIQDLSRLVPSHRLEDEKIRKLIQNGSPLSPTLSGLSNPSHATSGLAGPGARRATGGAAGNITTGLPIDDKDKGPNKGDILNGAVSWTRDLMWMLHLKLQQQEELMNTITELGGQFPFELTEDERRMQSELMEALSRNETAAFNYSRTAGSGLRVPDHTDIRGEPLNGAGPNLDTIGITPNATGAMAGPADMNDTAHFWHEADDDGCGNLTLTFKPEDEYDMDLN